jgi:hypothetical protein
MVHPGGAMKVATFTSSVQVSGVRCQQLKSIRWIGVAQKNLLSFTGVDLQSQPNLCSGLRIRFFLTPET